MGCYILRRLSFFVRWYDRFIALKCIFQQNDKCDEQQFEAKWLFILKIISV